MSTYPNMGCCQITRHFSRNLRQITITPPKLNVVPIHLDLHICKRCIRCDASIRPYQCYHSRITNYPSPTVDMLTAGTRLENPDSKKMVKRHSRYRRYSKTSRMRVWLTQGTLFSKLNLKINHNQQLLLWSAFRRKR